MCRGCWSVLRLFCHPRTRLVVSFHNWLWQPMLKAAEHLGQRQPQPPESWLTPNDVRNLLDLASWEVLKEGESLPNPPTDSASHPNSQPLAEPTAADQQPGIDSLDGG